MASVLLLALIACAPPEQKLIEAVRADRTAEVRALLSGNIDVNKPGAEGKTALYHAVDSGSLDSVRLLMGKGADPLAGRPDTLQLFCEPQSGMPNQVLPLVVPMVVKRHRHDKAKVAGALTRCAAAGATTVVRTLLEAGAEPRGFGDSVPLRAALAKGHQAVVDLLRSKGARLPSPSVRGK